MEEAAKEHGRLVSSWQEQLFLKENTFNLSQSLAPRGWAPP